MNIIAHSMGGLIVREAVQRSYAKGEAPKHINKIVTLGTPHQGISFQVLKDWIGIGAAAELEQFNPDRQKDPKNPVGFKKFAEHFPPERVLTVVGTNYRTYGPAVASWLNRAFSVAGEFGPNYNRSDGLVKQTFAQLPGAPRTFVHKCHGGPDSLVTSREAFEVATRFFFGNIKVRLNLLKAKVKRGKDLFGKSEFFFGVSIKPRRVDFELFHQSAEAENCYGPFSKEDLSDKSTDGVSFNWADGDNGERLIWEGWLDTGASALAPTGRAMARRVATRRRPHSPTTSSYGSISTSANAISSASDFPTTSSSASNITRVPCSTTSAIWRPCASWCCTPERISRIPTQAKTMRREPALPTGNSTSPAPVSTQPSASPSPWSEVGFRPRRVCDVYRQGHRRGALVGLFSLSHGAGWLR